MVVQPVQFHGPIQMRNPADMPLMRMVIRMVENCGPLKWKQKKAHQEKQVYSARKILKGNFIRMNLLYYGMETVFF